MKKDRTVLIVDDDDDFVLQQTRALEGLGFRVLTAYGRSEAVAQLEKEKPDIAIVDLMMEEMDGGFVLSHHIKKLYPQTPIILVTAVTAQTGLEFGAIGEKEKKWVKADVILAKPIRFEQLKREIERFLV